MSAKNLRKKYDKILDETRDITTPIFNRMLEKKGGPSAGEVEDDGIIYEPCGVADHVEQLDPVDLDKARQKMDEIITQVEENPFDFPDAARVYGQNNPGTGTGDKREIIQLPQMGKPSWFKRLKGLVKAYGRPVKKRSRGEFDIEMLIRNVDEKDRIRSKRRNELVFTIVDTSGSMLATSASGRSYMEEMAKYVPQIVEDYDGEVLVIDTEIKDIFKNKDVKKALRKAKKDASQNQLMLAGGGGTNFNKAYAYIVERSRNEKFEALVIVLTDAGVFLPANMVQELGSTILVAPLQELEFFEKNNKDFMAMVASDNYPAVQIVAVDFSKQKEQ